MNECIGHVIGKPHSPVTGLYLGKAVVTGIGSEVLLLFLYNLDCKFVLKSITNIFKVFMIVNGKP